MTTPFPDVFVVLTGGTGRRLGGVDKASIDIDGHSLFDRAIGASAGRPVVVVGPRRHAPAHVTFTREDPPGGGPAAGVAAGVAAASRLARSGALPGPAAAGVAVAIAAVDQVGVSAATWRRLAAAAVGGGAVLVSGGRRQYGVGVFPFEPLRAACQSRRSWHGQPLRKLLDPLVAAEVDAIGEESLDIDTLEDLHRWGAHAEPRLSHGGSACGRDDEGNLK